VPSMSGIQADIAVMDDLARQQVPDVWQHMQDIGLPYPLLISQSFLQLFIDLLPSTAVLRVLDLSFLSVGITHQNSAEATAPGLECMASIALSLLRGCREELLQCEDICTFKEVYDHYQRTRHNADRLLKIAAAELSRLPRSHMFVLRQRHLERLHDGVEKVSPDRLMRSDSLQNLATMQLHGESSVQDLYDAFVAAAPNQEVPDYRRLSQLEFHSLLQVLSAPLARDPWLAQALFQVCSTDGSFVDFKGVVRGIGCLSPQGTVEERSVFFFNLFDADADGQLARPELCHMVQVAHELYGPPATPPAIQLEVDLMIAELGFLEGHPSPHSDTDSQAGPFSHCEGHASPGFLSLEEFKTAVVPRIQSMLLLKAAEEVGLACDPSTKNVSQATHVSERSQKMGDKLTAIGLI